MSPEHAKGKPVDKRADIWAFGCVLYEMLSGRREFRGETLTDTLASVIRADPDWTALPASTLPGIRRLLLSCLQKDPKRGCAISAMRAFFSRTPQPSRQLRSHGSFPGR